MVLKVPLMLRVYETFAEEKTYSGYCAVGDTEKYNPQVLPSGIQSLS